MSLDAATIVGQLATQLAGLLRERLAAVYRFNADFVPDNSAHAQAVNLLTVLPEPADMPALREAFQSLDSTLSAVGLQAPAAATTDQLVRHLQLHPLLHRELVTAGRLLHGRDLLPPATAVSPAETWAYWSQQTLEISPILAPMLLEPNAEAAFTARLNKLAGQLGCPIDGHDPPAAIFAHLQAVLQNGLAQLPVEFHWPGQTFADAPPLLPQLQAIYEVEDGILFVLPDLPLADWTALDWPDITEQLGGQYRRLRITTAAQFRLAVQFERPLDIGLDRFSPLWGEQVLADLPIERRLLFRQAARSPSNILIHQLAPAYLSLSDSEKKVHRLIHDFQNQLMNIQLQHELLIRLNGWAPAAPPEPLPDPKRPWPERIAAIFSHLDWWATYYVRLMNQAA